MGYLFIFSLKFQKPGTTSEAALAPRVPSRSPVALGPAFPPVPSLFPSPSPELCVSDGLERMDLLNYSPFHATEQFQRCHILLFGDP